MAIDYVETDPGNGGSKIATYADQDDLQHELIVIEKLDSSGNPVQISDSTPLPVVTRATSSESVLVGSSTTSGTLLAANTNRKGYSIYNGASSILYVCEGTGASSSTFKYKLRPDDYYESGEVVYTGVVTGVWASADGAGAQVTELT